VSELPVLAVLPDLVAALRSERRAVLVAPPGAGKTTLVPGALLDAGLAGAGSVAVLQPRRVAARAAARRIAALRGGALGQEVGYSVRFERRVGRGTRIEILTEGLLVRRLQQDPFLEAVGCVVLDEFHERSLHADLALAMVREAQAAGREDLHLVVMSATLDVEPVVDYLQGCPVIQAEGRVYPVQVRHDRHEHRQRAERRTAAAVLSALDRIDEGHVLVFLPGVGEITSCERSLNDTLASEPVQVLPLHSRLPGRAQDAALAPSAGRKVVLATTIAQTSVTLPGVSCVVDAGWVRRPRFDPAVGLQRLERVRVSRASADQRTGRAGRTRPGSCRRLWTDRIHASLPRFDLPEIRCADPSRAVLDIFGWGGRPDGFAWFEPPPESHLSWAVRHLQGLGAVQADGITERGRELLALPLAPRLGALVLAGHRMGVPRTAAAVAALLSERDIVAANTPVVAGPSDLLPRLEALLALRGSPDRAGAWGLDRRAVRAVQRAAAQIEGVARRLLGPLGADERLDSAAVSELLLQAFPDRVARRRAAGSRRFRLAAGSGAVQSERSAPSEAPLVLAVGLRAGARGERAEHIIDLAHALSAEQLPSDERLVTRFDPEREAVVQTWARCFGELVLAERPASAAVDPLAASEALLRAACVDPRRALGWDAPVDSLLARLTCLRQWLPNLELPAFEDLASAELGAPPPGPESLLAELCAGRRSFAQLRKLDLGRALRGRLGGRARAALDAHAPERIDLPSGVQARLRYSPGEPPVLAARIQHLFGLHRTPTVAQGRVAVVVHLLAPNGRPAQITSDLHSFWRNTYAAVRKDLRGRYPKHAWPEDPLAVPADFGLRRRRGRGRGRGRG